MIKDQSNKLMLGCTVEIFDKIFGSILNKILFFFGIVFIFFAILDQH